MADTRKNEIGPALQLALARGFAGRCPNCGKGKLFRAYLKQVDQCSSCNERYSDIATDDAAPWFTMLIAGVLAAPLFFGFQDFFASHFVVAMLISILIVIVLILFLLPRIKGVLISAFWYTRRSSDRTT